MVYKLSILITAIVFSTAIHSQEMITGTQTNAQILKALKEGGKPALKSNQLLTLPFFDDFSGDGVYPDPNNWANNDVFINNDYPVFPVTAGVATFDAIDENGLIYSDATSNRFKADFLTSHPIRLDSVFFPEPVALKPHDSIYLSFYFQPEGLGFAPSESDSLVLEFYYDHAVDTLKRWVKVWSTPGMTLNAFYALHGVYFKKVMIPLNDTAFLKPGFRFRFYNIASILYPNDKNQQSNRDQWNVDYVYINRNRSINDNYYSDIAFANKPGTFLKNYQSMPYYQYKQNFVNEMRDSLRVRVSNLNNIADIGSYSYTVSRNNGNVLKTYQSGNSEFQPYSQSGYVSQTAVARPPVEFVFPIDVQNITTSFSITHVLSANNSISGNNDTVKYEQLFSDYYAYDDGTAEIGYGLTNAGGRFAYKFKLNAADTLTAFNAFFNRTLNNANQKYFHFQIWSDFGGKPGALIHEQLNYRVEYGVNGLNHFYNYQLDEPVYIENTRFPGLVFYIGIEQTTSDLINIGFDRNNITKQNIFYFLNNDWNNTMFDGSLMLRPVLGTANVAGVPSGIIGNSLLRVFPNPVNSGILNLQIEENWILNSNYQILNLTGMEVLAGKTVNQIDVSRLPSGMYLLRITNGNHTAITRFVVNR